MNTRLAFDMEPRAQSKPSVYELRALPSSRDILYANLLRYSGSSLNDKLFAQLLASYWADEGGLPLDLGLSAGEVSQLLASHFPYAQLPVNHPERTPLDPLRTPELEELVQLLSLHAVDDSPESTWMAQIVASGCMASDHLWQDLGLWSRKELGELMQYNFPRLAAKNERDMKWKKFLYKQLCIQEGIYTCRSPSCEVCADYAGCFGPEE